MVARATGIDSVVVRVFRVSVSPAEQAAHATSPGDDMGPTRYFATVYGRIPLPIEALRGALDSILDPAVVRSAAPAPEWGGEPLVGGERFDVHWGRYTDYLSSYAAGGKGAGMMRDRLIEAMPDSLSRLLTGEFGNGRPTRTWFYSEATELNELPWELLAYGNGRRVQHGSTFVRGIPPDAAPPLVPISGRLRLGLVDPDQRSSGALRDALGLLSGRLEIVPLMGGGRQALREAAESGIELLHVVADASITSSYDGWIEIPGADDLPLPPGEVAKLLRGSRVRSIGLTPPAKKSGRRSTAMAAAYRAFAHFATTSHPLPTVVAPLGPMSERQVVDFWSTFYGTLGETLEIEKAMVAAQRQSIAEVALFLRQVQSGTFRRVSEADRPETDPSVVDAELASSRELVEQFESLNASLGVETPSLDRFLQSERKRQSGLEKDVSNWIDDVETS